MNSEPDPDLARAARSQVIALLARLPSCLGSGWALDDASEPDWTAWRAAQDLTVPLRIGVHEFTFLHSLDPERSARLVVECRCGIVQRSSTVECYYKLLALNHQNFPEHACTYALAPSTKTVVYITSYLLESLDADRLADVVIDAAQRAMAWQEEFAPASDVSADESNLPFVPQM
jgi:hypothetical protein